MSSQWPLNKLFFGCPKAPLTTWTPGLKSYLGNKTAGREPSTSFLLWPLGSIRPVSSSPVHPKNNLHWHIISHQEPFSFPEPSPLLSSSTGRIIFTQKTTVLNYSPWSLSGSFSGRMLQLVPLIFFCFVFFPLLCLFGFSSLQPKLLFSPGSTSAQHQHPYFHHASPRWPSLFLEDSQFIKFPTGS